MKLFCALTKSACAAEISVLEPVPALIAKVDLLKSTGKL